MIKNAVLHPIGEQPMLADLLAPPHASDVSLLCTNLRTIDGKRPTAIDDQASLFIIPLSTIRFIEAPAEAVEEVLAGASVVRAQSANVAGNGRNDDDGHSGAGNGHGGSLNGRRSNGQAVASETPDKALVALPGGELHGVLPELEHGEDLAEDPAEDPSEELLRRIRDI